MNSTIARNLRFGFGLSLLLLLSSTTASYLSIRNLLESSKWVNHTYEVIQELENMISTLKDAETGQRGYLLTGEASFLSSYSRNKDKVPGYLSHVQTLTKDNPAQQGTIKLLKIEISNRLNQLQNLINKKKSGKIISAEDYQTGERYMNQVRNTVRKMKHAEEILLAKRTQKLNKFSSQTPVIIILAAIFAIIITVYFYSRLLKDFSERVKLQQELLDKDAEINNRIRIIQNIAEKISAGDYSIRVKDEEKDGLGNLTISLNRMAESLEYSFDLLSEKEWLQTGLAALNEKMVGEKDIHQLASTITESLALYTNCHVGTFYLMQSDRSLKLAGSYAFRNDGSREHLRAGEGIPGKCAESGLDMLVEAIPDDKFMVTFASGEVKPLSIFVFPVFYENKVNGVIELGSLKPFSRRDIEFLKSVSHNTGIAIYAAQNRRKLQELLEETQAQAEELQSQHSELESLNTEMEVQTQKLQASEEELRVQQEELLQANQELEERSALLGEKNQVIAERTLEIQRKADDLEQSTRYKSEFLANMSHELRTPLNSILLLSRMMAENAGATLNAEHVESARVIQNSGKSLLSLIDEILDLSKIEAGKMELEYLDVSFEEIAGDMKSLFKPIAREKNLELNILLKENLPGTFSTDKLRLEQILKNLLANALKFTAKGSVSLEISAGNPGFVEFSVKDTGIGISPDKKELIFEAFKQADGSTGRKFGGTGLGLSISRELSKLLGGEIIVRSEPGMGSEFIVNIPLAKPSDTIKEIPQEEGNGQIFKEVIKEEGTAVKRFVASTIPNEIPDDRESIKRGEKLILIVEDDIIFAKTLLKFTHKKGYKGVVAVRGDHATEMAKKYKPSAILLDIQLPVKDGWEVMEELKSDPKTRQIPVHIMSSMEVKQESLLKGAVDFINKPMALEQMHLIFQKLEEALSKNFNKVMIIEENPIHAKALAYYLETFNITADVRSTIDEGITSLKKKDIDCVILDMGIPDQYADEMLEMIKKSPGLENLPIILFTGKNLSKTEENKIREYADSIVVKTAHSYQRILDEVALFLHLIEENTSLARSGNMAHGSLSNILKDKKVLIADDDIRNIYSLTKVLENHKMNVVSAMDGKEALLQLAENPDIDLILMDMMMPEMDGYESTATIRQNPKFKNLPILAVTAKAMAGDREKCIRAGASDYISKPVDMDQLISLLRVWLYG